MKPLNIFQRFANWIKSLFKSKHATSDYARMDRQRKIEMCQEAILHGVCHHHCENCAWNCESYTGVKSRY